MLPETRAQCIFLLSDNMYFVIATILWGSLTTDASCYKPSF
jgi:hypothetical protein